MVDNAGKENEFIEFKESTAQLEKGLISLTAMLNKHCRGEVLFGVRDNGDIIGQDIGKDTLKTITQAVKNNIDPTITPIVSVLVSKDGRKYISLKAEADERPYMCKGVAYIRSGEENLKVNHSDLVKMITSSRDLLKMTISGNQDLSFNQLYGLLEKNGITVRDTKQFRYSLGFYNIDGKYNLQAELLSDQNVQSLSVVIFTGVNRTVMSSRRAYGDRCLLSEINDVLDFVGAINDRYVDVTKSIRVERDLFDFPAFREAWINACVHNNWTLGTPPAVHIFDDRMEIISYGDKPYWLSEREFFEGRSMPVNESLMRAFISVGLCEQTGHGVPVITEKYGEDVYDFTGGCVVVTIPFSNKRNSAKYRTGSEMRKLTSNENLIIDAIREHPDYTLDEIAYIAGLGRGTVGRIVPKLQKDGFIERKGSKRDGVWVVK